MAFYTTSPPVNCMQSTDNKHSISQREKRVCTSLFCSRRKSKDVTPVASQNWGHNMRAAQVFNISPASNCTHRVQFCLTMTSLSPCCCLHMNMLCTFHLSEWKQTHFASSCELTSPPEHWLCTFRHFLKYMVQNTRRTHGGINKLQTQIMEQEAVVIYCPLLFLTMNQLCIQKGAEASRVPSSPTIQL